MSGPLEQFEIHPIIPLEIAGYDVSFTNSSLWMVFGVVATVFLLSAAMKRKALVPGRMQNVGELLYEFVTGMVKDGAGDNARKYFPFIFTIFMTVLMSNLLGLLPYAFTPTSHIMTTGALAILAIGIITAIGFCRHGFHFLTLFVPHGVPWLLYPLIVPIELISYLSRPFSLSVRLFANMMAGHTMIKVFAGFSVMAVQGVFLVSLGPLVLNIALTLFELLIAILQAYVFAILCSIYLRDAVELH